jgi:N-acetylmuramoyl-L-alanine amidase
VTPWERLLSAYRSSESVSDELKKASLAQWIIESGRGQSPLAKEHLNFAGLKYRARMSSHCKPVDYTGSDGDAETYCKFSSIEKFIDGYWHFIKSGPYEQWSKFTNDGAGYVRYVKTKGYAADPHYVEKVLQAFPEAERLLSGGEGALAVEAVDGDDRMDSPEAENRRKVAIVVGHNRSSQGAAAGSPIRRSEWIYNTKVSEEIVEEAWHYNILAKVFFRVPSGSYSDEIRDVYAQVSSWGASCALELHFNSGPPSATGTETLFRSDSSKSRNLAVKLQASVVAALGLRDRGLLARSRGERGAGSLYAAEQVPTALAEPFFGSNASDCLRVGAVGENALALAYLRGLRDFLDS